MTSSRSFRTILLALTAGALGAIGCVITVGEVDCSECSADVDPDPLCHSEFNPATGECECDAGYVFESNDPNDFECEREGPKPGTGDCGTDPQARLNANGECVCNDGFSWCSDDPADLTCCAGGDTDTTDPTVAGTDPGTSGGVGTDETGTGTGGSDTDPMADTGSGGGTGPAELPTCDDTLEGQTACTNNGDETNVENGDAFFCSGGEWTEVDMDAECVFAQADFSYGCFINDSDQVEYLCGDGPGTDCTDADDNCSSDTLLQTCLYGKLTNLDCENFCTGPEAKVQTDFGTCDEKTLFCCCFDEGDEGNCQ